MGQLAAGFENLNKILQFSEDKGDSISERKKKWLIGTKTYQFRGKEYVQGPVSALRENQGQIDLQDPYRGQGNGY